MRAKTPGENRGTVRSRLLPLLGLVLFFSASGRAAEEFHALLIRSVNPPDTLVLSKFKINGKTELYRLDRDTPLTASQYKKLPRIRLADVASFLISGGRLQVRTRTNAELQALPSGVKEWPGSASPLSILQRSNLSGQPLNQNSTISLNLLEGWRVYLFRSRPGEDAVAFALAEARNTQAAWEAFLERFPSSPQAPTASGYLGEIYAGQARQALDRFESALQNRTPGYGNLAEAGQWFDRLQALNLPSAARDEVAARLTQLESGVQGRLRQAQLLAENADFTGAQQSLGPLLHFRPEFPELGQLADRIQQMAAAYYWNQARQLLAEKKFDEAVAALHLAASYRALEEIPTLRDQIEVERKAFLQNLEIEEGTRKAQQAVAQKNYAVAFDLLAPLAARFPDETRLQESFASLRRMYREALLAEVVPVEQVHAPIQGRADEEALLKLHRRLERLAQFESTTEITVWRDRFSSHLADYYRKRATELAPPEGHPINPLAFAYLQQAYHFILNKSELTQYTPWRERVEEQMEVRLALDFRDQTPEGGREYLVAEMTTRVGAAIQGFGFPHVEIVEARRGVPAAKPVIEFVVQLLRARVREDTQSENVASTYSAGTRQVPNPAWREAKTVYDQAVENHEQVRQRVEQNRRRSNYNKKQQQADDQELDRAVASLNRAKQAMDAVPGFVEEEDLRPYEFTRRPMARHAEIRLAYRWVNALTGVLEGQDFLEDKESAQEVEITGVHVADRKGQRNQPASLPDGEALMGRALRRIQQKLAERGLGYLKSFIDRDFERAREKAERGESASAAEDYLRFLYNAPADDPRRPQALDYLEKEFRVVTLQDWLAARRPERH